MWQKWKKATTAQNSKLSVLKWP